MWIEIIKFCRVLVGDVMVAATAELAKERRKRSDTTAGDVWIEGGRGIQAPLHGQFQAASSDITDFYAGIAEQFMLNAERPCKNLGRDVIWDQVCRGGFGIGRGCGRNVDLQQSATGEETLAGTVGGSRKLAHQAGGFGSAHVTSGLCSVCNCGGRL